MEALSAEDIRARFREARRSGRPAWLWPELPVDEWRDALGSIEGAVRAVLNGGHARAPFLGSTIAIGVACYTSGLGPLLGRWAEEGRLHLSDELAALVALHLDHNRARTSRMGAAAATLLQAMVAEDVPIVLLKAIHNGPVYFPETGTRPASDIDLLIRPEDAPIAESVLGRLGFGLRGRGARESSWMPEGMVPEPRSLTFVHADDPWSIDLHTSLDIGPGQGLPIARLDLGSPMVDAPPSAHFPGAGILPQPLLLLHLATHAGAGLHNLTMLRLVELVLVIRRDEAAGTLSWTDFLDLGVRCGALGFAYPALLLCQALAPGTVPGPVLAVCAHHAPGRVRRVLARLTPATAQRVERGSLSEHFMWAQGWLGLARQIAADLAPDAGSWRDFCAIYERRAWQILRGAISR